MQKRIISNILLEKEEFISIKKKSYSDNFTKKII